MSQPLLSICIPTFNRAEYLDISLDKISKQKGELVTNEFFEILVSDNCSDDNTPMVVKKHNTNAFPIRYFRNDTNVGGDRNFVKCFSLARGKYLWLLGDDDFLNDGALQCILNVLKERDYGLVHINVSSRKMHKPTSYKDAQHFITNVSFYITFISSNIVMTKYVSTVGFEKYIGTSLIQVPLYLTAALNESRNIILYDKLLQTGAAAKSNGGYDLFEVFINKYLNIWEEFFQKGQITRRTYEKEKHNLFRKFLTSFIVKLLYRKDYGNFLKPKHAWKTMFDKYWYCPYFYIYVAYSYLRFCGSKIKAIFR